ncbi:MAG: T9SS type A sorting domain-containing protein [Bacteroidales bacterium]|nr:T9SS type A sorting domain-containing protein [Bacteroidales bacterium]
MFLDEYFKRNFLLAAFTLLLASNGLNAQSWKVISRDDTLNYKRSTSSVPMPDLVVRVISEEMSGNDTILNLNKLAYEIADGKALVNQSGFLQKQLIIKPDGLVTLNDTAVYNLYPSAGIGANWLFNSTNGITAEVISITEEVVLGLTDSVKTINLSDGNQIKLSKNWGILSFPDVLNEGVNLNLVGIDNKRIGEFFPNHVDFANSIYVGDKFYYSLDINQYGYPGPSHYESTDYRCTIDSKMVSDSAVKYFFSGVSRHMKDMDYDDYISYSGVYVFPLIYTNAQEQNFYNQIKDSYPGDYFFIGNSYLIIDCEYDTPLRNIRKRVGGRPYNRLENDTLYFDYDPYSNYTEQFTSIFGIPPMFYEHQFGDPTYDVRTSFYLVAWKKPWGGNGNFPSINFTNEKWPVISQSDTMSYRRNNTTGNIPDESIWVTSFEVSANDTILQLNRKVLHTDENYYIMNGVGCLLKEIQIKMDKSVVLVDTSQYVLYPTADIGSYWVFDQSKHISAFVESVQNETILGLADKMKTFKLSNGKIIKLSKNWGIMSIPNFNQEGETFNLTGIMNQNIGEQFPNHTDYALGWEVGNLFRTREGRIENLSNGTVNEYITHKQFEIKEKSVTDSTVKYLVSGYRWEEMPQEPISYFPYNDVLEFSLKKAPFVGREGLGRMQDKFDGDTLITHFNDQTSIHTVEWYYDSLFQTTGKRIFGPPFQAIRNDTLIPVNPTATSLFECRYDALPGLPTVLYSDKYYGSDLEDSQTFFSEIVAWSTPEGSFGEFIANPLGLSEMDLPKDVTIYPNPFKNILNFNFHQESDYQMIEIYDASGIRVYLANVNYGLNSLDLSQMADGLYFAKISGPNQLTVLRIVKLN